MREVVRRLWLWESIPSETSTEDDARRSVIGLTDAGDVYVGKNGVFFSIAADGTSRGHLPLGRETIFEGLSVASQSTRCVLISRSDDGIATCVARLIEKDAVIAEHVIHSDTGCSGNGIDIAGQWAWATSDGDVFTWVEGAFQWNVNSSPEHAQRISPLRAVAFDGSTLIRFGPTGLFRIDSNDECRLIYEWEEPPVRCFPFRGSEWIIAQWNREVICLDDRRVPLWRYRRPGSPIVSVCVCRGGNHVAITCDNPTGSERVSITILDYAGRKFYGFSLDHSPSTIEMAGRGRFVLVRQADDLSLFDYGTRIWREVDGSGRFVAAISTEGRLIAVVNAEGVRLHENTLVATSSALSNAVRRVRQAHLANSARSICLWFDEFYDRLARGHLDVCEGLLDEIRDPAYRLSNATQAAVDSRQAALVLRVGLEHHRRGDYSAARACYQQSQQTQKRVNCQPGAQLAAEAILMLDSEQCTGQRSPALEELLLHPYFLEGSDSFLQRELGATADGEAVILAAIDAGRLHPILHAVVNCSGRTRRLAAATSDRISAFPGEEERIEKALMTAFGANDGFVRWQGAETLSRRDTVSPACVEHAARLSENEHDPEAKAALMRLLGRHGSRAQTPYLVAALSDDDAEVRAAAAQALSRVGDRRCMAALRATENRFVLRGRAVKEIKEFVDEALCRIEERHPLTQIATFVAKRRTNEGWQVVRYFRPGETIHFHLRVTGMRSDVIMRLQSGRFEDQVPAATRSLTHRNLVEAAPIDSSESSRPIRELDLSIRTLERLERLDVRTLGELIARSPDDLLGGDGFDTTQLKELREKLQRFGCALRDDSPDDFKAEVIGLFPPVDGWAVGQFKPQLSIFDQDNASFEFGAETAVEVVGDAEFVSSLIDKIDASLANEIVLLANAHHDLREGLLGKCLEAANLCRIGNNHECTSQWMKLAGRLAQDLGNSLSPASRAKLRQALDYPMPNVSNPLEYRIEIALVLDQLGCLTDSEFDYVPVPVSAATRFFLSKHLVTNRQYQRFLNAPDFADPIMWEDPYCIDCNGSHYSLRHESLRWLSWHSNLDADTDEQGLRQDAGPRGVKKNSEDDRIPSYWNDHRLGVTHPGLPVVGVSWFEANAYCRWLLRHWNELDESRANSSLLPKRIRLPTENEWCRAVSAKPPSRSVSLAAAHQPDDDRSVFANIGRSLNGTSPTGMFPGWRGSADLMDVLGNAWEWQSNLFDHSYRSLAVRGGAFTTSQEDASVNLRGNRTPAGRDNDLGFRILIDT